MSSREGISFRTALLFGALITAHGMHGQTTPIPDAAFEQALVNDGIDSNGMTGDILNSDAQAVWYLDVDSSGITDLTGLEAFTNLITFSAKVNTITTADFSPHQYLWGVYLNENQLTSVDLSQNADLHQLWLQFNQLTALDITNNLLLFEVLADNNQLTSIDLLNNDSLKVLRLSHNALGTLDLSANDSLRQLSIADNLLSSLSIGNLTDLRTLFCDDNDLTALDVSQNTELLVLHCSENPLGQLDLSNNLALETLGCSNTGLSQLAVGHLDLAHLYCDNNQITELDINRPSLNQLICHDNLLEELDLSATSIWRECLVYNNQLLTLNFQNGLNAFMISSGFGYFNSTGNPDLNCVVVDDVALAQSNFQVDPWTGFSLDCAVGIDAGNEPAGATFEVYPDPVSDVLQVTTDGTTSQTLEIFS
ncbi:MAG: hypothetical protein KDB88_14545, partial [Flavobacteriales bacterium]|nr:hypothetical protein [Flavobacteriales bacterium]